MSWLIAGSFVRLLRVGGGLSLTLLPGLGMLILIVGCATQPSYEGLCLVLCVLVLSCLSVSWRHTLF